MRIYEYGKDEIPRHTSVIAIGLFDGVHTAHRELINRARRQARELSLPMGVFTFSSDTDIKSGVGRIYTTEQRLSILAELGVDFCILAGFSDIRNMSAEQFCGELLIGELGCRVCAVGYNFRFGKGASADAKVLEEIMKRHGATTLICEKITDRGSEISSSVIREHLKKGDIERANALLHEPYFARGYVTHGRGIGSSRLGVPTVNIAFDENSLIPRLGVYLAEAIIDGVPRPAIANIGTCPTYGERRVHIEAHLFDFSADLYGKYIRINFLSFLRDEKRFSDENELKMQIKADISTALDKYRGIK